MNLPAKLFTGCLSFIGIILISFAAQLQAEEEIVRKWTDTKTGRTLMGHITEKTINNQRARVKLTTGKSFWLTAKRLSPADQKFIVDWIEKMKHITARIVKTSKGRKTINIVVKAGSHNGVVTARDLINPNNVVTKELKAGEKMEFEFNTNHKYRIDYSVKGKVMDSESWNRKTGL